MKVLESKYNLENIYIYICQTERIISWFYYHKNIEPYKSQTLNEWIQNGCKIGNDKIKQIGQTKNITSLLQYNFIDGNKKINYIGKMRISRKIVKL